MNLLKFAALTAATSNKNVHPAFMKVATTKKGPGATDATKNSRSAGEAAEAECINEGVSLCCDLCCIDIVVYHLSLSLMYTTMNLMYISPTPWIAISIAIG